MEPSIGGHSGLHIHYPPLPPSLPPSLLHQGVAEGIRHGDEVAKAKYIIGDPSYFPKSKTKVTGR